MPYFTPRTILWTTIPTRGSKMSQGNVATTSVEVSDFGPIVRAAVELRPLTVFVGPSNTGKSYLAMLAYALHRFVSRSPSGIGFPFFDPYRRSPTIDPTSTITDEDVDALEAWMSDVLASDRRDGFVSLPDNIASLIRPILARPRPLGKLLDAEIASCFGFADTKAVIRHGGASSTEVSIGTRLPSTNAGSQLVKYRYSTGFADDPDLSGVIPETVPLKLLRRQMEYFSRHMQHRLRHRENHDETALAVARIANAAFLYTTGVFRSKAYYLPADRTGIMHAHSIVVRSLIGQATHAGLRQQVELPMFSGVMADFLAQLIDLPRRNPRRLIGRLGQSLETDLLGGSVHIKKSESNYPHFSYKPRGWKSQLSLMNASSMVSELVPIALYLRYVVQRGEVLIIEEPESHLHPAMQVELAHFLAKVVNAGVRLIITTHSEIFLEALGNLVGLDNIPSEERHDIEGSDSVLSSKDVGVWLFSPDEQAGGSVVEEIEQDDESGAFPARYDEVNEKLYNDWATIYGRRQQLKRT